MRVREVLLGEALSPDQAMTDPRFTSWFRQSKVVDVHGHPLIVYHGGQKGIKVFGDNYRETLEWADRTGFTLSDVERAVYANPAHFFTDDPYIAEDYADQYDEHAVYEVYLRIEHPLDLRPAVAGRDVVSQAVSSLLQFAFGFHVDDDDRNANFRISQTVRRFHHLLKGQSALMGHDGIIMPDTCVRDRSLHTSFVVFSSNQIKSVANNRFSKSQNIHH